MTEQPDLTETQKAYNVAHSEMFQLAAYGHHRYHPSGEALTDNGKREQAHYNNHLGQARENLEAAVLRLVAEHAETFPGDRSPAWLRALADDPAQLSLLGVRPDERDFDTEPAVPSAPAATNLRERIADTLSDAGGWKWADGFDKTKSSDYQTYLRYADAVLVALKPELDAFADYENRITWGTTCGSCARILDSSNRERERAEKAEATLAQVRELARRWENTLAGDLRYARALRIALADPERTAEPAMEVAGADRTSEARRLALSEALGLGTGAPWDAILDRAAQLSRLADEAQVIRAGVQRMTDDAQQDAIRAVPQPELTDEEADRLLDQRLAAAKTQQTEGR